MDKDCVINPKTGRAVKIGSVAGKRVMKTDSTPTHDCVINPKTGRAVKKTGAVGKKIVGASSTITQAVKMKIARKTVEKAKEEAKPKTPPPAPPAPPAPKPNPMGGMAKGGRKKKEPPKNNLPELPRDVWKKVLKFVHTKTDKDGFNKAKIPVFAFSKTFNTFYIYPHEKFLVVKEQMTGLEKDKDYIQKIRTLIDENKIMGENPKIPQGYINYKWGSYKDFKDLKTPSAIEAQNAVYKYLEKEQNVPLSDVKEWLARVLDTYDIYVFKIKDVITHTTLVPKKYYEQYAESYPKDDYHLGYYDFVSYYFVVHATLGQTKELDELIKKQEIKKEIRQIERDFDDKKYEIKKEEKELERIREKITNKKKYIKYLKKNYTNDASAGQKEEEEYLENYIKYKEDIMSKIRELKKESGKLLQKLYLMTKKGK